MVPPTGNRPPPNKPLFSLVVFLCPLLSPRDHDPKMKIIFLFSVSTFWVVCFLFCVIPHLGRWDSFAFAHTDQFHHREQGQTNVINNNRFFSTCAGFRYDLRTKYCFGNVTLCPITTALCGQVCYDPTKWVCRRSQSCPPYLERRPLQCLRPDLNPSTSTCLPGHRCCDLSIYSNARYHCINPQQESCCVSQLGDNFVCPLLPNGARMGCCQQRLAAICYDPRVSYCCSVPQDPNNGGFSTVCAYGARNCCRSIAPPR